MANVHNHDAVRPALSVRYGATTGRADDGNSAVIIDEAVQSITTAVVGQMPTRAALRQKIQRSRGTIEAASPQPLSRASIVLPDRYVLYGDHERFLLFDSGRDDGRSYPHLRSAGVRSVVQRNGSPVRRRHLQRGV
ncbi:hypothetical protein M514_09436 [Trichuris suis]|nr:hypothetical protein M514_09436 [Trichuris suis]